MKIKIYHWWSERYSPEMNKKEIAESDYPDAVIFSAIQKRYYIPEHLKSYKKKIIECIKFQKMPDMSYFEHYTI